MRTESFLLPRTTLASALAVLVSVGAGCATTQSQGSNAPMATQGNRGAAAENRADVAEDGRFAGGPAAQGPGKGRGPGSPGVFDLPDGYQIEKVVDNLQLPSSLTWDDQGNLYVAEAGGGLFPQQLAPIRILKVANGQATPVVTMSDSIEPALVGLVWHEGAFYFTHRASNLTGAVSRATLEGRVELVFDGILDSQAEHQINDIDVGPDGLMYVSVGPAGNAGVMGPSVAPWVMRSPGVHTTPCEDIVLTGHNFKTPNFLDKSDGMVLTGAYMPFGKVGARGTIVRGVQKCGGSILTFDPADAATTLRTHAWGFRNLLGLTWDEAGNMFAAENGYDVRGSRPVQGQIDATLRVERGRWYGVPDFSASREPLTQPQFEPPDHLQAPVVLVTKDGTQKPLGKVLGSVIDHKASGLTPPRPEWVLGRHIVNSSPSMIDIAPATFGRFGGHLFVAEWGDLAPPTNPLRKEPAGYRVVAVNTRTGEITPFVQNRKPGPASAQGAQGMGMERPFDVQFGPDGALYIVDYGVVTIDKKKKPPYAYQPGTGAIWRVTRTR